MRAGSIIVAAAVLTGAAVVGWAQEKNTDKGCDSGVTQQMVECLAAKTAQWDRRLNIAYQKVIKEGLPRQREQLRSAQRLWIQYRDANCRYWILGEGTIARINAADCMYRMTRDRAVELGSAAERN